MSLFYAWMSHGYGSAQQELDSWGDRLDAARVRAGMEDLSDRLEDWVTEFQSGIVYHVPTMNKYELARGESLCGRLAAHIDKGSVMEGIDSASLGELREQVFNAEILIRTWYIHSDKDNN